jgi:hypothetical protein
MLSFITNFDCLCVVNSFLILLQEVFKVILFEGQGFEQVKSSPGRLEGQFIVLGVRSECAKPEMVERQ